MLEIKIPEKLFIEHKTSHDYWRDVFQELIVNTRVSLELRTRPIPVLVDEVVDMLQLFWDKHFHVYDMVLADFLKRKRSQSQT